MGAKRKNITKKVRFEVFKRDSFTCQYCGQMSPDVILEIDHINPVSNGGTNELINLITSCADCNRGKSNRLLTEKDEVKKQQKQLKELSEKREQLKMMVEWKKELMNFEEEQVDYIENILQENCDESIELTQHGRNGIAKTIKKFGIDEVMESTILSIRQYYKRKDDAEKCINYIPKICANRNRYGQSDGIYKMNYVIGILRNRQMLYNENRVRRALYQLANDNTAIEICTDYAKSCKHYSDFRDFLDDEFGVIV